MSDILTRLLLNTGDYDSKLAKAKASSNDFASSIGSKAVAAVGKFAAGIGVAMGAAEAFEKAIKSSQTTSDEMDRIMRSVSTTVDGFFTAISTGDFSSFNRGLNDIITRARAANDALDQLGNTTMSYGYFNTKNQAEFAEAITTLRDKNASAAEKEAAKATADRILGSQREITEQFRKRSEEAAAALVTEGNTLGLNNIKRLDIDKVLGLDVSAMGSDEKAALAARYEEYTKLYNQAVARNRVNTPMNVSGVGSFTQSTVDYNAVAREMEGVTNQYQDAILYNEILVRKSDDWLKNLIGIINASDNAVRSLAGMEKQLNRATQSEAGGGGTKASKTGKKKDLMPVVVPQIHYDTPIGKKMLEAMAGKKFDPIEVPIVIEEDVEEEDLSGAWAKHLTEKTKAAEDMNSALSSTADIFGSLGSIAGTAGNDFLAATMQSMGSIAQMIMQLQALTTAQGVSSASALPFPANLAAIATVVATVASVFASLPKFADGGIVGGSSFFGDKLLARVNSGEMILNQGQQARLLSMVEGGNVRVSGDVRLSGKDIYVSLRNYMSASGNKL